MNTERHPIDPLLTKYVDALNAGNKPNVAALMAECPEEHRDQLRDLLETIDLVKRNVLPRERLDAQMRPVLNLAREMAARFRAEKRVQELEAELRDGDSWRERLNDFISNGGCPFCFAGDCDGHKPGCEMGRLEKLEEVYRVAKAAFGGDNPFGGEWLDRVMVKALAALDGSPDNQAPVVDYCEIPKAGEADD